MVQTAPEPARRSPDPAILGLVVIALAASIPFWSVATLPAMDYPAHLARLHILTDGLDPSLARYYRIEPQLLPNLAIDLVVPPLGRLLGVETAFRIVITAIMLLPLLGAALLQSALFGRIGLGAVAAGAFLFNGTLTQGFYNSAAGSGLALVALALWVRLAARPGLRLAVTTALASAVWLCHAFSFLLLGLMIGVVELADAWHRRDLGVRRVALRLVAVAAAFAPGLVAFALAFHAPAGAEIGFDIVGNLASLLLAGGDDGTGFLPSYLVLVPVATLLVVSWREKRLRLPPPLAVLCLTLAVITVVMPESIAGGTKVGQRIAPVLWVVFFASAAFGWPRRVETGLVAVVALSVAVQAGLVTTAWMRRDGETAEFRRALEQLPVGVRIAPVTDAVDGRFATHSHLIDYAVIDRRGLSPIFFTLPGQQIVRRTAEAEDLGAANTFQNNAILVDWFLGLDDRPAKVHPAIREHWPWLIRWSCRFEAVAFFHATDRRLPADPRLEPLETGTFFDLYRVRPAEHCRSDPPAPSAPAGAES